MKKILMTSCALLMTGGMAIAQTATPPQAAPAKPATADHMNAAKPGQAMQGQGGVQRVDASSLVMTFYTATPADTRASKIIGQDVYNLQNENIGEVSDLILDNGKTVKAVVVSVGGFLGIGDRNVAISPTSIVISDRDDGNVRLVVNTTKENLKAAKPFDFAEVDKASPGAGQTTGSGNFSTKDGAATPAAK